jgi:FkbM family methyltransferase
MASDFHQGLQHVEKLARLSKMGRLWYSPLKYLYAILYRGLWLPLVQKESLKKITTFFDRNMLIGFPSGTDMYLTGGKTDDSELRMTRFLLQQVSFPTCFIDIGAHIGYYSLLADALQAGKVIAIEPSPGSFDILVKNTASYPGISVFNMALSDKEGIQDFYEFPHRYSEYNTLHPQEFRGDRRLLEGKRTVPVACTTLDILFKDSLTGKIVIKIDAEGAENAILLGGQKFLATHPDAIILMEYIDNGEAATNHRQAVSFLQERGFVCWRIDVSGNLVACDNVEGYMRKNRIKSDNLVFIR